MQTIRREGLKRWVLGSLVFASAALAPHLRAEQTDFPAFEKQALQRKLEAIRLPENRLEGTTLRAAIEWLRNHAATRDTVETETARKGITVVVIAPNTGNDQRISLNFPGGTLEEACRAIAKASRRTLKVDANTVAFSPAGMPEDLGLTREFGNGSERKVAGSIRYGDESRGASISAGFTFPASASLASTSGSRLVMRNSQPDLATLEKLRRNP
jgi:hypothetical protein